MVTYRFTSITRKDCISFLSYPDDMALTIAIWDVTSTPPPNSGLNKHFNFFTLQLNPSKSLSKETQVFLLLLRKANIWALGVGTPSPLLEHRI